MRGNRLAILGLRFAIYDLHHHSAVPNRQSDIRNRQSEITRFLESLIQPEKYATVSATKIDAAPTI